jgi:hypothetical protein
MFSGLLGMFGVWFKRETYLVVVGARGAALAAPASKHRHRANKPVGASGHIQPNPPPPPSPPRGPIRPLRASAAIGRDVSTPAQQPRDRHMQAASGSAARAAGSRRLAVRAQRAVHLRLPKVQPQPPAAGAALAVARRAACHAIACSGEAAPPPLWSLWLNVNADSCIFPE